MGSQQPKSGEQAKAGQKPEDMDARDARKKLEEQKRNASRDQKQPKSGEKSPTDPARRVPKIPPEDGGGTGAERDDDVPPWVTALPPEIRDAFAGGQAEKIPPRYRHLIQKYNLWLQKNAQRRK